MSTITQTLFHTALRYGATSNTGTTLSVPFSFYCAQLFSFVKFQYATFTINQSTYKKKRPPY